MVNGICVLGQFILLLLLLLLLYYILLSLLDAVALMDIDHIMPGIYCGYASVKQIKVELFPTFLASVSEVKEAMDAMESRMGKVVAEAVTTAIGSLATLLTDTISGTMEKVLQSTMMPPSQLPVTHAPLQHFPPPPHSPCSFSPATSYSIHSPTPELPDMFMPTRSYTSSEIPGPSWGSGPLPGSGPPPTSHTPTHSRLPLPPIVVTSYCKKATHCCKKVVTKRMP